MKDQLVILQLVAHKRVWLLLFLVVLYCHFKAVGAVARTPPCFLPFPSLRLLRVAEGHLNQQHSRDPFTCRFGVSMCTRSPGKIFICVRASLVSAEHLYLFSQEEVTRRLELAERPLGDMQKDKQKAAGEEEGGVDAYGR